MLRCFSIGSGRLQIEPAGHGGPPENTVWIDLASPSEDEERLVEQALGIEVPTRQEAGGIQVSDRLFDSAGTLYMSAIMPGPDHLVPPIDPITFIRTGQRLLTVRYSAVEALEPFLARVARGGVPLANADDLLAGLLESAVDQIAERQQKIGEALDGLSHGIFHGPSAVARSTGQRVPQHRRAQRLEGAIKELGSQHAAASRVRDCAQSLIRLAVFSREHSHRELQHRLHAIETDLRSVADHNASLAANMEFMLDATVGLIEIQQNKVIYLLSIVGVVLTPPVLVASIYGMNFHDMPELSWPWGYPMALGLMLLSAIGPFLIFKLRGWL
ncbi:MAG: CorA family divalent cation transporter [Geminicoccaceae bacterium]